MRRESQSRRAQTRRAPRERSADMTSASRSECPVIFSCAHSRSFTTLEAIRRLRAASADERGTPSGEDGTLRLLLVGADRVEGTCPKDTAAVFEGLVRCRGDFPNARNPVANDAHDRDGDETLHGLAMEGVDRVDMLLVGPNIRLDSGVEPDVFHTATIPRRSVDGNRAPPLELRIAYHVGMYHDIGDGDGDEDDGAVPSFAPDLALAFNAGIWGYAPEEWRPTLEKVLYEDVCPLVVTGYTLEEAENDEDALTDMFAPGGDEGADENEEGGERDGAVGWVWEAEMNPFRSLRPRELDFDRSGYLTREEPGGERSFMGENCAWQCLTLKSQMVAA